MQSTNLKIKFQLLRIFPILVSLCVITAALNGYQKINFIGWDVNADFWMALVSIILLMPLNILIEAGKLKLSHSNNLSLFDCFTKTCQGFSLQLLLPAGLGALVGRTWNLNDRNKRTQIEGTLLGGVMQSLCNLSGLVLLFFIPSTFAETFFGKFSDWSSSWAFSLLGFTGLGFITIYLFRNWFHWKIWRDIKPLNFMAKGNADWNSKKLSLLFVFSFIRYLIYLTQWIVVLLLVGQLSFMNAVAATVIYLAILTLIVVPPAFSIISRSGIAWAVYGAAGMEPALALSLCWLIFLLNNGIPAMMGSYFMLKGLRWARKR